MSDSKVEQPKKADDVDIISKYNEFIEQIPWGSIKSLPLKFKKYAGFLGIDNVDDLDLAKPLEEVISFIGVLVKRIRTGEKRHTKLEDRVVLLEQILEKELEILNKSGS